MRRHHFAPSSLVEVVLPEYGSGIAFVVGAVHHDEAGNPLYTLIVSKTERLVVDVPEFALTLAR